MLESYFFIPANKPKFIGKAGKIDADHIIFDMEDTVPTVEREQAIENLKLVEGCEDYWVRPSVLDGNRLNLKLLNKLRKCGFINFVIPKLFNKNQLEQILQTLSPNEKLIILIETPSLLHHLSEIIDEFHERIWAIGFGSQDFAMYSGMRQDENIMNHARFSISIAAKAYNLPFIDTASMIISEKQKFEKECVNAFNMGCSGKFIIHPDQLEILNSAEYFTKEEIVWGKKVLDKLENISKKEFSAYNIDGMVLEKPHLNKVKQIKKYLKK